MQIYKSNMNFRAYFLNFILIDSIWSLSNIESVGKLLSLAQYYPSGVNQVTQSFRYLLPTDSYRKFENRTTHVRVMYAPSESICTKMWRKKKSGLPRYIMQFLFSSDTHQFLNTTNIISHCVILFFFVKLMELNDKMY